MAAQQPFHRRLTATLGVLVASLAVLIPGVAIVRHKLEDSYSAEQFPSGDTGAPAVPVATTPAATQTAEATPPPIAPDAQEMTRQQWSATTDYINIAGTVEQAVNAQKDASAKSRYAWAAVTQYWQKGATANMIALSSLTTEQAEAYSTVPSMVQGIYGDATYAQAAKTSGPQLIGTSDHDKAIVAHMIDYMNATDDAGRQAAMQQITAASSGLTPDQRVNAAELAHAASIMFKTDATASGFQVPFAGVTSAIAAGLLSNAPGAQVDQLKQIKAIADADYAIQNGADVATVSAMLKPILPDVADGWSKAFAGVDAKQATPPSAWMYSTGQFADQQWALAKTVSDLVAADQRVTYIAPPSSPVHVPDFGSLVGGQ